MTDTLTVVIYAAKSTADEKGSIPDQVKACETFAADRGWSVDSVESDENASAYSGNRGDGLTDALDRAAELAKAGTPAGLLVWHSNRIARGAGDDVARHLVEYYFHAVRGGFELHSVQDDHNFQNPMYAAIAGHMAHEDSKIKSANVKRGLGRRRDLGLYGGGRVYGYLPDETVGLVPDPEQAPVVRRIFTLVASGKSQAETARILNREGVPTLRDGTVNRHGRAASGKWSQGNISAMVKRRLYLGEIQDGDDWREAEHEAIVSEDVWKAANAQSSAAARVTGRKGGRRPKAGHLLPGRVLRHRTCGSAMVQRSNPAKQDGSVTGDYTCSGRKLGLCEGFTVSKDVVDDAVVRYVAEVGIDAAESLRLIREATAATRQSRSAALEQARSEAAKIAAANDRMWRLFKDGELDADDWQRHKAEHETESKAAAEAVERLEAQVAAEAEPEAIVPAAASALDIVRASMAAGDSDAVRNALEALFQHFDIDGVSNMPEQAIAATAAEFAAARRRWAGTLAAMEAEAGRSIAEGNTAAMMEAEAMPWPEPADDDDVPELDPAGVVILPVPREDALQSVVTDGQPVPLVDAEGRPLYRRVPLGGPGLDPATTNRSAFVSRSCTSAIVDATSLVRVLFGPDRAVPRCADTNRLVICV